MSNQDWDLVKSVVDKALTLSGREKDAYLNTVYRENSAIRTEIEELMRSIEVSEAKRFMKPMRQERNELISDLSAELNGISAHKAFLGKMIGRYCISEQLGGGGMGVVYKAQDTKLGRQVAMKFLPPYLSADAEAKKRFLIEARAAAALDHANISTIYEIGQTEEEQLFIAMACYEGETLEKKIARGALSVTKALDYTIQIGQGLSKAHAHGIVHRDIKPANIMITEDEEVKILDFGLAKMSDMSLTKLGTRMGTVAYMSPEQIRGEEIDHRTDCWSLGVVFYELLTGEVPFPGDNEQAIFYRIQNKEPAPMRNLRSEVPEALELIVQKALEKPRADRYDTIQNMVKEIKAFQTNGKTYRTPSSGHDLFINRRGELLPKGERRQATLVVAQLDGYAGLVEQLVPEDLERMMRQIRELATDVVKQHGGVLNQFTEDEMVALFGIPVTHEDDFIRASRVALQLTEGLHAINNKFEGRTGEPIQWRTGIDTGLVVAHQIEYGDQAYRITGNALQVATGLATQAKSGDILASPESRRLIAPFFETEPCEPIHLKNGVKPVTPYRVLNESGTQSRIEATTRENLTKHTGREKDLGVLEHSLEHALRGEGQFVTVEGEAGLGKSRLLYEFRQRLDRGAVQLLQGRCQSYGDNIPYLPFIEILKESLRLNKNDPKGNSIEQVVDRIRTIAPELDDFIPLYLHLLSIPSEKYPIPKHLEGEYLRLSMIKALSAIFTLSAKCKPIVILLEDWHWADDVSREVLKQMVEMISAYPLFITVTYRPEYVFDWGYAVARTPVHLCPLEPSSSITLMKSVAHAREFPEELGQLIHERTGGNPFFLEEICRALLEEDTLKVTNGQAVLTGDLEKLQLPDSIQAVIRTRLDRTDRPAREVLCAASVIGREFSREVLQQVLTDFADILPSLETLRASGLIQQTHVLPEAKYLFKHVLTQEVAYESLLQHHRKTLHGRAGQVLEVLHPNRTGEQADILAYHFNRAEDWEKAVHYGLEAAGKANELSQFSEALRMIEETERWLSKLPEDQHHKQMKVEILLMKERLFETMGLRGRQQEIIDKLLLLLELTDNQAELAEVYLRQGDLHTLLRQYDSAEKVLNKALCISQDLSDAVGERNILRSMGLLRWHEGRNKEALEYVEGALSIDRQKEDVEAIAGDLLNLGSVFKGMGEYERARGCLEEALKLSENLPTNNQGGLPLIKRAYIQHNLSTVLSALGDTNGAIHYLRQAIDEGARYDLPIQQSFHLTSLAYLYLQQNEIDESLRLYKEAIDLGRKSRYVPGLSQVLRFMGEVLLGLNRRGEALPYLQESAELFAQLEDHTTEALMWGKIASAYEEQENFSGAMAAWGKTRTLYKQTGKTRRELEALEGIARTTRLHVKEPSLALNYYLEALKLAKTTKNIAAEGRLRNTIGIMEWNQQNFEKARIHYEKALAIYKELGDQVNQGLMQNSLGVTLKKLSRLNEAIAYLEEAITLNHETGQHMLEGHGLAALAEICFENGNAERALSLYKKSLDLRRAIDDRKGEGWMLLYIARVHASEGELAKSREYATQASEIALECSDDLLLESCLRLQKH